MRWTFCLLIVGLVMSAVFWCQGRSNGEAGQCASAGPSPGAERSIFARGVVEGRQRDVGLRFEITGRLASVLVHDGDQVSVGQTLARLDPALWMHELAKAEASLALAQAERERLVNGARKETREFVLAQCRIAKAKATQASKRLGRGVQLRERNAQSQQDLDDLEGNYEAARAELEAATARADETVAPAREDELRIADAKIALEQARVLHAQNMLEKTDLKAPSDGLVLRVRGEPGELVGLDRQEPVVTMVDVTEVRVRASVEEMDALAIVPGQRAYAVADGMPDTRFLGTVACCSPYMTPKTLLHNSPGERIDVKIREIVITIDPAEFSDRLVVGLPVDVFVQKHE